ncbi:hypothetical protein [Lysinibacillus piscis]|uniref:Uncharacterized protein n=1 Tax=Lysinibacillus piscis TaxID=2518931 RepID=A0ABQ5NLY1_9BACI|nr:hypothetical protein [Lysinibacillus sp. KH24]GLC89365.1 hypothetical protein LYSBPC_24920 [Lysinibacillus sp. KH24]
MNAKEITVGYTYTKNLGNYENVKVDAAITITVEPGQDVDALYDKAYDSMKKQVKHGLTKFGGGY